MGNRVQGARCRSPARGWWTNLWTFQRCEKSASLSPENRRGCLRFNLSNSSSLLRDIHSAAKSAWQGLGQRAHFQWPLTLVRPDTYDECLQDTEGRQPAMSGFYYVLQRLGTVSLIKQIILEGKATGKRRRKTGGKCVFATHSDFKKKEEEQNNHPHNNTLSVCVPVCVCTCCAHNPDPDQADWKHPPIFSPSHQRPQGPLLLWKDQVQTTVMRLLGAASQPPSSLRVSASASRQDKEKQDHLGWSSYIGMSFIRANFPLSSPEEHSAQQLPQ